jgi:tRNA (guanine-N7-)-methyltransferase
MLEIACAMSDDFTITTQYRPEYKKKSIRSFVIRSGRMTESQANAFDSYWKAVGLSLFDGPIDPQSLFGREAPLVVEIGFGMGDSLVDMAAADTDSDFIGIEVHPPGVGRLINRVGNEGLSNLKTYMADANDVLEDCIADASLARVQLYFPDPWHKKKHHKRRIVQPEFVAQLVRKLKPGGKIHMATDWENYAQQMLEVLQANPDIINDSETGDYVAKPAWRPHTKFEARGERLGHGVWDLLFSKK